MRTYWDLPSSDCSWKSELAIVAMSSVFLYDRVYASCLTAVVADKSDYTQQEKSEIRLEQTSEIERTFN